MAEIPIEQNIFEILNQGNEETQGGAGTDPDQERALQQMTNLLTWGAGAFHDFCQEEGYPGLGSMKPEKLAELGTIVAERQASSLIMKNSPEITLAGIILGLGVSNFMAYRKKQIQGNKKKVKKTEEEQTDG